MVKTFFDFCSGIGTGRMALESLGLECVGHCEIDMSAINTYHIFFNDMVVNYGDIMNVNIKSLPNFDIMLAGFPCQTFSINGKRAGFLDDRGQIIFGLIEILKIKKPKYFILENVKGLVNHNNGKTIQEIVNSLVQLGYHVEYNILNSLNYGVPQMRERVYFVGIKKENYHKVFNWNYYEKIEKFSKFLDKNNTNFLENDNITFQKYLTNKYNIGKYEINSLLEQDELVLDTRQSDLRLYKNKFPTLRTGRHGILYVKNKRFVKLNGFEALLLQGVPQKYANKILIHNLNNLKILSQAGNAMTVNVIEKLVGEILTYE